MKNTKGILMSVLMIGVVATALGATLADFSDIEISEGNYFSTGSLDLAVSDYTGKHYNGENIPVIYEQSDAWPCCDKSRFFDLENVGQGAQVDPCVYIHFKKFDCYWVQPKDYSTIWVDEDCNVVDTPANAPGPGMPQGDLPDFPKPLTEPEYVAECGGIAGEDADGNLVEVPGIGLCYGETCELPEHVGVLMWVAGPYPDETKPEKASEVPTGDWKVVDLSKYDEDPTDGVKLDEIECDEIDLGKLPCNHGIWVHISLHFQDFDEEDAFEQGLITTTYFDEDIPAEKKWDHWPTNALQKDGVKFNIAFELLQSKGSNPNPAPTPPTTYTLTTSTNPGGGTTTGDGSYEAGSYAPITATANTGYTFTGWIGEGITDPPSPSTTVLMDKDKTATAKFEAVPALCNGGFETGDFTCWTTTVPSGASAKVVTYYKGKKGKDYKPVEGSYFALLKTAGPDSLTEASQQFDISAGMKVKGWAAFDARDHLPYNDYAQVRILDSAGNVVATPWYCDVKAVGSYGDGPWAEWVWTATASGTYTLEFSTTNAIDSAFDSYALFDANVIV